MQSFRRILVGVDFSLCAENALREAARLAALHDSELRVVHVIHDEMVANLEKLTGLDAPEIALGRSAKLEQFVADALGGLAPVKQSSRTFLAHRFAEMMRQVEAFQPDLLVLGRHGDADSDSQESRAGSLAASCVRKAPCRVLLVDQRHRAPYRNVVAAVDFSEHSRLALYEAAEICRRDRASLHVIHVHYPPWIFSLKNLDVPDDLTDQDKQSYRSGLERELAGFLQDCLSGFDDLPLRVSSVEKSGAAAGILSYLGESGADLVVLGTRGRSALEVQVIGSTAEQVVNQASISILSIKTVTQSQPTRPNPY